VCGVEHGSVCTACLDRLHRAPAVSVPGVRHTVALVGYDDLSARLVLAGKNGGRRDLLRWSGVHLARAVARSRADEAEIDLVSWVPADPAQRRIRGYDQGELLARSVARHLGRPCRATLRRSGGGSQKGLSRALRLEGPQVRARRRVPGSILLVDDVVTTGASLSRCADVLIRAGATTVDAAVFAAAGSGSASAEEERCQIIYIGGSSGIRH
jgi:predicted amidophosphoribosyltransferase